MLCRRNFSKIKHDYKFLSCLFYFTKYVNRVHVHFLENNKLKYIDEKIKYFNIIIV